MKKELVHEVEDLLEDVSGGAYVCDEWQEEVQRVKRPARKAKMGEKRYADQDDGDTDMDTEGAAENGEEGGEEEEAHGTVVVAMANGMQKGAREEQLEEDEEGELSGAEIDAK